MKQTQTDRARVTAGTAATAATVSARADASSVPASARDSVPAEDLGDAAARLAAGTSAQRRCCCWTRRPRNGYQIMQEVQERSEGVWSPSPGSVYPALAQLEDEGLIRTGESEGRKLFAITDAGRKLLEERGENAPAPWAQMSDEVSPRMHELGKLMREVAFAFSQVMRTGSEDQVGKARDVLASARRDLYRILADGDGPDATVGEDS